MDEAQWHKCQDPRELLLHVVRKAGMRELRLFAAAACRRVWDELPKIPCREAVEFAESWADDPSLATEASKHRHAVKDYCKQRRLHPFKVQRRHVFQGACGLAVGGTRRIVFEGSIRVANALNKSNLFPLKDRYHCDLLRDIFGNPFRARTRALPALPQKLVRQLQGMYQRRDFKNLPAVADFLEEQGADQELIQHCRNGKPHVRGCWVVDVLLGLRQKA